jgi:uncharacterized membrane protein YccC
MHSVRVIILRGIGIALLVIWAAVILDIYLSIELPLWVLLLAILSLTLYFSRNSRVRWRRNAAGEMVRW